MTRDYFDEVVESKCVGNRNWVIRTENNTATLYKFGEACRLGAMTALVSSIYENNIHWYYFTYKKDGFNALEKLAEAGYNVRMYQG